MSEDLNDIDLLAEQLRERLNALPIFANKYEVERSHFPIDIAHQRTTNKIRLIVWPQKIAGVKVGRDVMQTDFTLAVSVFAFMHEKAVDMANHDTIRDLANCIWNETGDVDLGDRDWIGHEWDLLNAQAFEKFGCYLSVVTNTYRIIE